MEHVTSGTEGIVHGALDYSELERLGLRPEEVLDFSVNSNPYGPSPQVREALLHLTIERYPDRECLELRQTILDYELAAMEVSRRSIVCGNGTSELIWAIARAFLKPGLKAAILGPTFGEYRAACLTTGATVVELRAEATEEFQPDAVAFAAWIQRERPSQVWLCNPNNPTGIYLDQHQILSIAEACRRVGAILVIDEAYWRFIIPYEAHTAVELVGTMEMIVLRSLTKDFALAGLRLGYAVATPDVALRVSAQLPSWNVSGAAQAAGIAALIDHAHLNTTLADLTIERNAFFQALEQAGLKIVPSRTHFCLIEVGNAHDVRRRLLSRKMLVRDCTSFGLPSFLRLATRPRHDWQQLMVALKETL
jgi:histidinol-phosphate aminotransferase